MVKAVVPWGYNHLVMDFEDAAKFLVLISKSERYDDKGWGDSRTHHVWDHESQELTLKIISEAVYHGAKLAGKPQ